jgi:hypothetical protein
MAMALKKKKTDLLPGELGGSGEITAGRPGFQNHEAN